MEDLETYFGYAQTIAATLVRCMIKRRMSPDDKRSLIYYCELIAEKVREIT